MYSMKGEVFGNQNIQFLSRKIFTFEHGLNNLQQTYALTAIQPDKKYGLLQSASALFFFVFSPP